MPENFAATLRERDAHFIAVEVARFEMTLAPAAREAEAFSALLRALSERDEALAQRCGRPAAHKKKGLLRRIVDLAARR